MPTCCVTGHRTIPAEQRGGDGLALYAGDGAMPGNAAGWHTNHS